MKIIKRIARIAALFVIPVVLFAQMPTTLALDPLADACQNSSTEICKNRNDSSNSVTKIIGTVVNTLLYFVGLLSVIMIIVAGVMYTTSGGNAGQVSKAKGALTYAVVGLIVAFLAFAIVNWVFKLF